MNKKIMAFVLAGILATAMVVPAANATTLEQQIADLMAMIVKLEAQIAGQTAGAVAVCFDADLQQGMTSDSVKDLQIKLGVTPTSGYFGPITLAAVKTFQTSNGIINTGYVGPLTRGALNALYCTPVTPVTYPAGCTSAVGFSSTTGLPCSGAVTYPAGCTSAVGYSITTGLLCAGEAVTYPEGCTSAVGFSPTTGLSCAGTIVTGLTEGSITVTMESSPSNGTEIAYNTTKATMSLKLKATGGDMTVNRVDFNFNKRVWLYAEKAGLYDGSILLSEKVLTESSLDEIASGSNYRLRFDGLNFAVVKDATKILTLKLTAPSIIADPNTLVTITVATDSVRATGTTGLTTYEGVAGTRTFKIKTATDGSLVASLDSTSPKEGTVAVDDVDNTADVSLLVAGLKATGDAVNITSIPVALTVVTGGTADGVDDVVESVHLYKGGVSIASASYAAGCSSSLTVCTVTFSDLDETIVKDLTAKYTIKAELKPIDGTIVTANTTVQATLTVASIVAEDSTYDTLAGTDLSGSSVGLAQHMFLVAPSLTFVSVLTSVDPGSPSATVPVQPILTGTITFTVKAVGGTIYLNKVDTTTGADRALLEGAGGINMVAADTLTDTTYTVSGVDVVDQGATDYYAITEGQEATIIAQGWVTSLTPSGLQSVKIEGLQWGTVATDEDTRIAGTAITWGLDAFRTQDVLLAFY